MSTITDNGFARITRETLVRNPNTLGALTGNDIAFDTTLTINEKISTITGVNLTASSVGNVPIGNLVATNVQNALNELQSEVDTTIKVVADEVRINNGGGLFITTPTEVKGLYVGGIGSYLQVQTTGYGNNKVLVSDINGNLLYTTYTSLATILSTANTWTSVQTFLSGMMGLRNIANTFTSFFTNSNTGSRTYTLKDGNGTIAFTSDITGINSGTNTGDQTTIAGISGTLAQFNTAVTDADLARTDAANTFTGIQTITQIDIGNTDTSITRSAAGKIAVEGIDVLTTSSFATVTNKRVTKRVEIVASSATPGSNTDNSDVTKITGLAVNITSLTTGLVGTPADGDMHLWSFTDNGTARTIAPGASFENSTVSFPATTVISTRLDVLCEWNSATSKWRVIATA